MEIKVNSANVLFFNALASETRLKIIENLLPEHKNIKELAHELQLSSTIVAKHIEILEQANIVKCENIKANRGTQKVCRVILTDYHLVFEQKANNSLQQLQQFELAIGHFSAYSVSGTCGLSTMNALIGVCDDPRYFSHPERYNAGIVWFAHGEIEYNLPSFMFENTERISELEISLELCSEAPGINENFLSDIYFNINGVAIGQWVSPGDFGKLKGVYTPKWWYLTEYGKLVTIKINDAGTYINGELASRTKLAELGLSHTNDAKFKIISPQQTSNPGGVNIFGKGFGNYDQGIIVSILRK